MAPSEAKEKPFRFFDLARELRDQIYGELICDLPARRSKYHSGLEVTNYGSSALRLVSRQFKQETKDEVLRSAQLCTYTKGSIFVQAAIVHDCIAVHQKLFRSDLMDNVRPLESITKGLEQLTRTGRGFLPALSTLHVQLTAYDWYAHDETGGACVPLLDFRSFWDLKLADNVKATLQLTLLLGGNLFDMDRREFESGLDIVCWWRCWLNDSGANHILYKATPSDDPDAGVGGLDLTTFSAELVDWDALEVPAKLENARRKEVAECETTIPAWHAHGFSCIDTLQ
ncbi:hypothetical protein LTR08_002355 [Meristemomyces frigidus]|nr:hypothetical protein LTR08_002355 [Meristemomyces frigidus]